MPDNNVPTTETKRNVGCARHFQFWVNHGVDPGTAAEMMVTQAVNQAIRRCKIGMVTRKASA